MARYWRQGAPAGSRDRFKAHRLEAGATKVIKEKGANTRFAPTWCGKRTLLGVGRGPNLTVLVTRIPGRGASGCPGGPGVG